MIRAYTGLHESGWAHSVEVWEEDQLAGGLYGVSIGQAFFGESMFSRRSNASKTALHALVCMGINWDFQFIDCQFHTEHLARFGARTIPRNQYLSLLSAAIQAPGRRGLWTQEFGNKTIMDNKRI
jgi:leucyl/phenylalanyl-tRNA--protein transferase